MSSRSSASNPTDTAIFSRGAVAVNQRLSPGRSGKTGGIWPVDGKSQPITARKPWQRADGDVVTTYKTYHGTHRGDFLGVPGTGRRVSFDTVDAMRVRDGKIVEHWGVANLYSVMQQLGVIALPGG